MSDARKTEYTWDGAKERLHRLAEANRRATLAWLRSLTVQESVEIFEELSDGIPELDRQRIPSDHPVPLFRIWRP